MQGAFALIGVRHGAVARADAVCRDLTFHEDRTILLGAAYNLYVWSTTGMRNRANVHTRVSRGAHQVLRGGSKSSRPCRENHPRDRPFKFALLLAS